MLRTNFSRLNLMGVVLILAACTASDQAFAPKQSRTDMPAGAPSLDVIMNSVAPDSTSADFTVTPSGGMFVLGKHAVYFPDHAICDPATSNYGPGHWDEPCTPLDEPIQFHAEIRGDSVNGAWIDFSPSVRFVPSDDPSKAVWIMMKTTVEATESNYQGLTLLWTPGHELGDGVNEAAEDPSLKTYVDMQRSIVFRRIKHFTGYLVTLDKLDNSFLDDIIPIW
jgi:hypothetical protein